MQFIFQFDYQYGKYELGYTYTMKGQTVTRNFLPRLPFYPFCGRNQMFMSLKPGVNPPEFREFQFKYLTKLSDPSEDSRMDKSSEERPLGQTSQEQDQTYSQNGIWSNLKSFFGAKTESEESMSSQPRQRTQHQSQQINSRSLKQQSQQSSSDSQQQSQHGQYSSSSPAWYGFGIRFVGVGSKPERWTQFRGYYQRNPRNRQYSFNFHYSRNAFPVIEQHPYNVSTSFHSNAVITLIYLFFNLKRVIIREKWTVSSFYVTTIN